MLKLAPIGRVRFYATAAFVLAFAVRLYWVQRVQSPYDALFSDMAGYVERAQSVLHGVRISYPRLYAMYPYGAHYIFAAEFYVLGEKQRALICAAHALMLAAPAYFTVCIASRFSPRPAFAFALGVLVALWQPHVACVGFFVSEIPFSFLLYANVWLTLVFLEKRRSAIALGMTGAALFAIRPQFLFAFGLLAAFYLVRHRRDFRALLPKFMLIATPWLVVMAFSMVRFHQLTGRIGLISENGELQRFFGDTTVGKLRADWVAPNGDRWSYWFKSPAKVALGETEVLEVQGYIGDPEILARIREERLRDKSVGWRIERMFRKGRLLWSANDPWPEEEFSKGKGFRETLQHLFGQANRWFVFPLACVGAFLARKRPACWVMLAHLATLFALSVFFFPEARYRVPYDPMLLILAGAACAGGWRIVRAELAATSS